MFDVQYYQSVVTNMVYRFMCIIESAVNYVIKYSITFHFPAIFT